MSVIYSYPTAAPEPADLLVGTEINSAGEDAPRTRTFTIGSITTLAVAAAAESAAGLYATIASVNLKAPIASPTFTGTVSGVTKTMVGLNNVDNTTDLLKPISTATQSALDLKAPLASPTFTGTVTGINKTMVGLSNVDNTTDLLKPISTATQSALNLKANLASPAFTGTVTGIDKSMVGLTNVDNTTDLLKPISTATQSALNLKAPLASPAFTGTVSGIDKIMVGLNNVDNTSDAAKPVSTATQTALNLKVTANTLITGATFPKITYDTKGLVTSGSALIATDIPTILQSQVSNLGTDLGNLAPKASPTFTGTPLSTTAAVDTNTFQIATTAYVINQGYAKLSGASFTGAVSSTGSVTGNSIIKSGGTINQSLMANGAVSTDSQVLYKAASTTYQTAGSQVALQTSVFPISILTTGTLLKINSLTTTLATSVGLISTSYFISQLPGDTIVSSSCFQIATYNAALGNLYYPMDRVLWSNGTNLYVRNSTGSTNTSSGTANIIDTIPIASINNGGVFYITVLLGTTLTDRSCLSYVQVST